MLFLCYFGIINFCKIELLFIKYFFIKTNLFLSCSGMFWNLLMADQNWVSVNFDCSYHQDQCQEIKFFVGSIFGGFYLPRNLPVEGLNEEYYIWSAFLVVFGLQNEECYIWSTLVTKQVCWNALASRILYFCTAPVWLLSLWNEEVEETITFKARLFWFMAHRTRNITVEAFFWYLFELLYGLYSLYVKELMVSISACMLF